MFFWRKNMLSSGYLRGEAVSKNYATKVQKINDICKIFKKILDSKLDKFCIYPNFFVPLHPKSVENAIKLVPKSVVNIIKFVSKSVI